MFVKSIKFHQNGIKNRPRNKLNHIFFQYSRFCKEWDKNVVQSNFKDLFYLMGAPWPRGETSGSFCNKSWNFFYDLWTFSGSTIPGVNYSVLIFEKLIEFYLGVYYEMLTFSWCLIKGIPSARLDFHITVNFIGIS